MKLQVTIAVLTFLAVTALGTAVIAVRAARRERVRNRLREIETDGLSSSGDEQAVVGLLGWLGRLVSLGGPSARLKADLASAGFYGGSAPLVFMGAKVVLLTAGLILTGLGVMHVESLTVGIRLLIVMWGGALLFMVPNISVRFYRKRRQNDVRAHLPDALDLLEVCVSAGMGLDLAWNCVADEMRRVSSTLADEMALTDFEIHLNAPRAVAMRHMAQRTSADEIASLVAVLIQSERFGTSIGEALRTFAESMREARSQRAEEAAEKMVVKLLFPMILLIFPAVLVVIGGPAALRWVTILSG